MGSEVEGKLLVSFLSFPWGGDWATRAHATAAAIEQLLVCRFENLFLKEKGDKDDETGQNSTGGNVLLFCDFSGEVCLISCLPGMST